MKVKGFCELECKTGEAKHFRDCGNVLEVALHVEREDNDFFQVDEGV